LDLFEIIATLLSVAALFSYLNHRFLRLPSTIGLMLIGLLFSLSLIAVGSVLPGVERTAVRLLEAVDFDRTLMDGLLGFLLFAGALHVNLDDLAEQKVVIAALSSVGLAISAFLVGGLFWLSLDLLGVSMPFVVCLLFGALISPTDPIAVLAALKSLNAPQPLETQIAGESLFNDGVAVVFFLAVLSLAGLGSGHGGGGTATDGAGVAELVVRLFALETAGGALFGFSAGYLVYRLMRSVDSYDVEILLSLALVAGGYALARALHVSGPIAMVVAGLLIGNHGRAFAMSDRTREHLDMFWLLVDEILNAVLFVLIGLEVLVIPFDWVWLAAGALAVGIVLAARFFAVGLPLLALRRARPFTPHAVKVLTWGGMRGGISVALALSLKSTLGARSPEAYEGLLLTTYVVVVFSIAVQGLTIAPVLRHLGSTAGKARRRS
jgi:CPA1 family monovalent cation:H+ antiporter